MNTKLIVTGIVFASLLISGCQNESAPHIDNDLKPETEANVSQQHSLADATAYNSAIELKDKSFCDKITNSTYKENCITRVNNQILYEEAIKEKDGSRCDKISDADTKAACKISLEAQEAKQQLEREKQNFVDTEGKLMSDIMESGEITRCTELTDSNFASTCEANLLVEEGLKINDIKVCERATTEMSSELCNSNLKQALTIEL